MEQDELLPARMVNAFTFCPRLFWLEHVEGVFVDNRHTVEGQHAHRNVDKPGGKIPAPGSSTADATQEDAPGEANGEDEQPPWRARSLWLSNAEIGVSAKLDLVEEHDGAVLPVDTKKGRSDSGELWPPDRVQLTLQALLLRSHGYEVHEIAAFYLAERRRVRVRLSDDLIQEAIQAVENARACAQGKQAPPPLVDSPKCWGCSLNVVCLPDESNLLRGEASEVTRRVIPPRDDALPLYVQEVRSSIGLEANSLKVVVPGDEEKTWRVGLPQISQVCLMGPVKISSQALQKCMESQIPVSFFSMGGWYYGAVDPVENRQVNVRIAQFREAEGEVGLGIARQLIADKIANQRTLLRRNSATDDDRRLRAMQLASRNAAGVESRESLLGIEGSAARDFWDGWTELFEPDIRPRGRSRRPPEDPVNALLSYGYALLVKDCRLAIVAAGLDPYLGVFHTTHHGRPSLALDLMEPFRPLIVDSAVLLSIKRNEIRAQDFTQTGQAVEMKPKAKKALIRAYERRMDEMLTHPVFGYQISYRQTLHVHARLIARVLCGELSSLPAIRTR